MSSSRLSDLFLVLLIIGIIILVGLYTINPPKTDEQPVVVQQEVLEDLPPELPMIDVIEVSAINVSEAKCLAENIYHEARNQSTAGQVAVAHVTLNRVASKRFPNTICDVVFQGHHVNNLPIRHQCQFSWYCDGKSDSVREREKYKRIYDIAVKLLRTENRVDITDGALYYHADYVNPYWAEQMRVVAQIDDHIFYRAK